MNNYSEKEKLFLTKIGYGKFIDLDDCHINPMNVYAMAARKAFVENWTGDDADSLRRICKAIDEGKIFRLTKEFDDLIKL